MPRSTNQTAERLSALLDTLLEGMKERSSRERWLHGTDVSKPERTYGGGGEAAGERSQGRSPKGKWLHGTDDSKPFRAWGGGDVIT